MYAPAGYCFAGPPFSHIITLMLRPVGVQVHEKELKVVMIQNEVAKLTVDVLNTEAHNVQLEDTLKLLDEELADKAKVIDKYQLEIQRRNDDIEKKTRNVDTLNRKLEKLVYDMEGEDTGDGS